MRNEIQIPVKGSPMRTQWGVDVANAVNRLTAAASRGLLVREGSGGFSFEPLPTNRREKKSSAVLHPYEVRWAASLAKGETSEGAGDGTSGEWIIWLPSDDLLTVGKSTVKVSSGLEAAGDDYPEGWYKLDVLPAEGGSLFLTIATSGGEEESGSSGGVSADETGESSSGEAKFAVARAENAVNVLICEADASKGVRQIVTSAIVIGSGSVATDDVSISMDGRKESVDDSDAEGNVLQLAHFADDEMDSTKGLVNRLEVDKESGEVKVKDDDPLMLVARKNGKLIYVPLGGSDEGEDPVPDEEERDPCDHEGGGDSVLVPDESEDPGDVDPSGGGGGVPAGDGEAEEGVNDCDK